MSVENERIIKEIVGALRRLVRTVYIDSSKMSRQYGLTGSQSAVLRTLVNHGPLSSAALSRRLYVTPSNITGIIDRLGKKGLVQRIRKEDDRRVALIQLTESGDKLSRSLPDPVEKKLICELADLEPEHVQRLATSLNQILNLIDAKGVESTPLEMGRDSDPLMQDLA